MSADLDRRLIAAHAARDIPGMIQIYTRAAALAPHHARAFYLTQAMVFALEAGDAQSEDLRAQLIAMGCEAAL